MINDFDQLKNKKTDNDKSPHDDKNLRIPINQMDQNIQINDQSDKKIWKIKDLTSFLKEKQASYIT